MNDDFLSSTLAQFLKYKIKSHPKYHYNLKLLANCMTYGEYHHGVQIISNGEETRILGPRPCKNSWACPECTAREMSKYSTRISAGLEALYKKDFAAFMMTLTVFHTNQYSCELTYNLLRQSWTMFDKNKTWRRKRKDGSYYTKAGVWSKFYQEFSCNHTVKTLEITYGEHGWHPHIHMLIWVPKHKLQEVKNWETALAEEWDKCVDKTAKKLLSPESYQIRKFLESKPNRNDFQHKGLHISKTDDQKIKRWSSADYLCGWGGNNELTGLGLKIAKNDNMTPFQMLEKAYNLQVTNPQLSERYIELYLNFAWTVIKNRISRIAFSRTGLKQLINNYLQSEEFIKIIKKKKESLNIKPFRNVAWFSSEQWREICFINDYENIPLIPLIIQFAKYEDGFNLIKELMIVNNLSPPAFERHPGIDFAKCFNDLIVA